MDIFKIILSIISPLFLWSGIAIIFRSSKVSAHRHKLIMKVGQLARIDAGKNKEWEWRFDALQDVPFGMMVLKFWKPLDSFYPDKSFIQEKNISKTTINDILGDDGSNKNT